jgi:UDP-2-acetamido-3-amino-2,3-dideoxy-glucuronate N-acetyltransferase
LQAPQPRRLAEPGRGHEAGRGFDRGAVMMQDAVDAGRAGRERWRKPLHPSVPQGDRGRLAAPASLSVPGRSTTSAAGAATPLRGPELRVLFGDAVNDMGEKRQVLVHPSSFVDDGVELGVDSSIGPFCHVAAGARLGAHARLGQNVAVARRVLIGNHARIQNHVSIEENVVLEDHVCCGPGTVFTGARAPRSAVPRGPGGDSPVTRVKLGASIGPNVTVFCGVTIGEWAMIAAGSVVTLDVPPFALAAGDPATRIGWACRCGSTLHKSGTDLCCAECGRQYEHHDSTLIERIPA